MLFAVAIYVLVEAVNRSREPEPVQSTGMLIIAVAGLIINLISMRLLRSGKERSLNLKGAYLEVWADMLGSIGVIGGAIAIRFTGLTWIDPLVAVGIGLWVLPRTWILLRDTANVLLEGAPRGMSLGDVRAAIVGVPACRTSTISTSGRSRAVVSAAPSTLLSTMLDRRKRYEAKWRKHYRSPSRLNTRQFRRKAGKVPNRSQSMADN